MFMVDSRKEKRKKRKKRNCTLDKLHPSPYKHKLQRTEGEELDAFLTETTGSSTTYSLMVSTSKL